MATSTKASGTRVWTASQPTLGNTINIWSCKIPKTLELFTFVTSTKTGRRAVGNLLRHYNRTQKTNPNELPVVRLRTGGFQHKTPVSASSSRRSLSSLGRQPRDSVAKPDTSIGTYLNDDIPFDGGGQDDD